MKKTLKIILTILIVLVVLALTINVVAGPLIKNAIENRLTYYRQDSISVGGVQLHYFPLGLELKDVYFKLHTPMDSIGVNWNGNLKRAAVSGVDWKLALQGKKWKVEGLEVENGTIQWKVFSRTPDVDYKRKSGEAQPDILLSRIFIGDLSLDMERDSMALSLNTSMAVDSLRISQKEGLKWDVQRIKLLSKAAKFENLIRDFDLGYDQLLFDSSDSLLLISNFYMRPRLSKEQFKEKYPHRVVQPDLVIKAMELNGIDGRRMNRGLYARNFIIDSCFAKIFQDITIERKDVHKPLPSQIIAEIPFPIAIDSMLVKRSAIDYSHFATASRPLAKLKGREVNLSVYPVNNLGHEHDADVEIDLSIVLMDDGKLDLHADFPGNSPNHSYTVDVQVSGNSLTNFNPILYPSSGLRIKSGYCSGMRAHLKGNDLQCSGDLDVEYEKFKIALPATMDDGPNLLGKTGEFLSNLALVNNTNHYDDKNGTIFYERERRLPFVNFWWSAIQSGLMDSMVNFKNNKSKKRE